MSVQFGRWNLDGKPVDPTYLAKVKPVIAPYGPDDEGAYTISNLSILYRAFHTTKESRREVQPHVSEAGVVITWDGRLDNRAELVRRLPGVLTISATDVSIVAATYEELGADCFARLVGDWALSIWDAKSRSLLLAKDPIGTRHLYYSIDNDQVTWSTILDPLVLFAGKSFALCEEYIAGWFSSFPATHLTPYIGIHSVPPSSSVVIRNGKRTVAKYWDFDPAQQIRYRTDAEYEEHFRAVFGEAVCRRLRSDSPILAELSGGMDSSSIVCMADTIIARGAAETPRLDTISYYDDSEPNWNERPYFTKVEERRGRTGTHIDVGSKEKPMFEPDNYRFAVTPGSGVRPSAQLASCMASQGNRVVLSGIGGDEVTGGVPTPTPELEDLLATGHFRTLAHQLKVWALNKRKPWFYLLFDAARGFFPAALVGVPKHKRTAPWFNPAFVKRNRAALTGYDDRTKIFGPLPSFQENVSTLEALQRQLGSDAPPLGPPREKRYPYIDRSLLEFIYAIPREQLVRPGQRRSMMRRALIGMVPDELLNRKRKAFVSRGPMVGIAAEWPHLLELSQHMLMSSLGIANSTSFVEALQKIRQGADVPIVPVMRTLGIELWLRNLTTRRVLSDTAWQTRTANDHALRQTEDVSPTASNGAMTTNS
ncbi:MAG: asparagine synthase-related protein [Candidatus Acidiferrum sp.]